MNIKYNLIEKLPKLSWVARYNNETKTMYVQHGSDVETHETFFAEAVWDGEFSATSLLNAENVFGSGGALHDNRFTFIPSTATTDQIFFKFKKNREFAISNSLPLLLAVCRDELDCKYQNYNDDNNSITKGIYQYNQNIKTVIGNVRRLLYFNLIFDGKEISMVEKPYRKIASRYEDYIGHLKSSYGELIKNSQSPLRTLKVKIYSTQSRGYDSTAVNAIAKNFKLDKVFTIEEAKTKGSYITSEKQSNTSDSGVEICKSYNLKYEIIARKEFLNNPEEEYLFYSSSHICEDANFTGLFNYIKEVSVVLTGNLGEIWYPTYSIPKNLMSTIDTSLKRWDLGGHGLTEARLEKGFIQIAVPFIGARNRKEILGITDSKEMDKWRLNTLYDRPIPRRIAEESGISREAFGQNKMATVTEFPSPAIPINKKLKKQFYNYLVTSVGVNRLTLLLMPVIHFINTRIIFSNPKNYRYVYYTERLITKVIGKEFKLSRIFKKYDGSLYCYCVNERVNIFARLIKEENKG